MASSLLVSRAAVGGALSSRTAAASTPQKAQFAAPIRQYGSSGSSLVAKNMSSAFLRGGASSQDLRMSISRGVQTEQTARGGALTVEANLFGRIVRIVKSYANAIVSSAEDPEKLLDQTVIEMGDDLAKMRQASAQVLASQKQLEQRYKQAQSNADDWLRRAKLALQKGQEELAKEALKKKKDYEENAKALKAQLDAQKGVVDKLISNTRLLESKISEAKSKKDTLKARAQSAKTSQKVQEMLGNVNTSSAMAAFEKMEEKVMALEAESDAVAQLGTDDLSAKFALLESSDVDSDLDALKREMSGIGSKTQAALPGGQSTPGKTSVKDLEIEAELNELRKKASDL